MSCCRPEAGRPCTAAAHLAPLEDTLREALQLEHRAGLLGLSEDGGLAALDHDEHVHCSCLSPLTANPGGLNERFYNRDSKVGL